MRRALLLYAMGLLLCAPAFPQARFGPSREYRTVSTDLYEFRIQKNGLTDVHLLQGLRIFDNAHPEVQFADEGGPERLTISGRYTMREQIRSPLGEGQGITFARKNCQWHLRAFPAKPYFTVQVIYYNDGRKPVQVSQLIPWAVGGRKSGRVVVGPNASQVRTLEDGRPLPSGSVTAGVHAGQSRTARPLALYAPATGQSLVTGFLTHAQALTEVAIAGAADSGAPSFDRFLARCIYDPPLTVQPKQALASEVLYIAVAEDNPFEALERYGRALAAFHRKPGNPGFQPHGWDSERTTLGRGISEAALREDLDAMATQLAPFGWNHFAVGPGWERARGDWEANDAFPKGMAAMASAIHKRGLKAGIAVAPFTVDGDSEFAAAHPAWLLEPSEAGKHMLGENTRILDVSIDGANDHVRELCRRITAEWGYDAILTGASPHHLLLAHSYADTNMTRVEILRRGLAAMRDGMDSDAHLATAAPFMITGAFANSVRTGRTTVPVWESGAEAAKWGAVEAMGQAARRYYLAPFFRPDPGTVFFGHAATRERWNVAQTPELTHDQQQAWATAAALTGGVVTIGNRFSQLQTDEVNLLRKLLPTLAKPARPMDLLNEGTPRIWATPLRSPAGNLLLVGLFNWDPGASHTTPLELEALGLQPDTYYTVYEFWSGTYHGAAKDRLSVQLTPGSVRLYGFRRFQNRPMFLATDHHFSMGASDSTALDWDAATNTLSGAFDAVADADYTLRFLAPAPYELDEVSVNAEEVTHDIEGEIIVLRFNCAEAAETTWSLRFVQP